MVGAVALPLPIRNRLKDLILTAFDDPGERELVAALEGFWRGDSSDRLLSFDFFQRAAEGVRLAPWARPYHALICERARAYGETLGRFERLPADEAADPMIRAGLLFNARCYFEAHEILEPPWIRAEGAGRQALQGLIQVAVGFQHLANGNVAGATALLQEGCDRLRANGFALDLPVEQWAGEVRHCLEEVVALGPRAAEVFDWDRVPMWPTRQSPAT